MTPLTPATPPQAKNTFKLTRRLTESELLSRANWVGFDRRGNPLPGPFPDVPFPDSLCTHMAAEMCGDGTYLVEAHYERPSPG